MNELVRLRMRPSRDGKTFKYFLDYVDENGRRRRISLGHADKRKAERQRVQKERELCSGVSTPHAMTLRDLMRDSLERTRGQVRDSTLRQTEFAMEHFIRVVGNIKHDHVCHTHGERFLQACLDGGNRPATAAKKLRHLKRLFQLAVDRGQLDENPFRRVKQPRRAQRKIRWFRLDESYRLVKAAREYQEQKLATKPNSVDLINWELLVKTALCTGMRRGELLNTTWHDVDFEGQSIEVAPKLDSKITWEWHVKDTDRRTVPLTDELISLFAEYQAEQPEGFPYVFIPVDRYRYIQQLRREGKWSVQHGCYPVNNFERQFKAILKRAGISDGSFHDLRRTCLTNWLSNGLREYDVMKLAGHASFETTRRFYLGVRRDLLDRARLASVAAMESTFGTHMAHTPFEATERKKPPIVSD
jgi:integrase